MSRSHSHTFEWNDREAFYMCTSRRCRAIEAKCGMCGKRLGTVRPATGSVFCSPEHETRFRSITRDDDRGPAGLRSLLRF